MGAGKSKIAGGDIILQPYIFCCDSAALIDLQGAGLINKARTLVSDRKMKIPQGVYKEIKQETDKLAKIVERWEKKYSFVVNLDYRALEQLPNIEKTYGPQFSVGGITYPGFWKSPSGKKSVDAQVLAMAKSREWIVVSNDNSIHGACMLENIVCRRWEEIGRLLLGPEKPRLPGL